MSETYKRVALIGLGLIASSMAHAMRRDGMDSEIVPGKCSKVLEMSITHSAGIGLPK